MRQTLARGVSPRRARSRVRLLSSAPAAPGEVAGRVADYDADTVGALADATALASLATSVGNDTLVQATGANQPTKQTVSGLPVVRFDGVNDRLRIATGAHAQPMTTVLVAKLNATGTFPIAVDGGAVALTHDIGGSGTPNWLMYAGTALSSAIALNTAWHIIVAIFNGAWSKIRIDGGAGVGGDAGAAGRTGLTIGSTSTGTFPASMDFRRLVTYDRVLTVAELNALGPALVAHSPGLVSWTPAT